MYKSENQIWAVTKLRRCSTFKAGTHIGDDDPEAFREASAWDWRKKKKALREALTLMEIWKVSFFKKRGNGSENKSGYEIEREGEMGRSGDGGRSNKSENKN
ncbi:unnamed protein product [Prunus brigantina]